MRCPTLLIGLSSGQEAWLTIDLASIRFTLEIENGKQTTETLTVQDLRARLPHAANVVASVLAEAVRNDRTLDH